MIPPARLGGRGIAAESGLLVHAESPPLRACYHSESEHAWVHKAPAHQTAVVRRNSLYYPLWDLGYRRWIHRRGFQFSL